MRMITTLTIKEDDDDDELFLFSVYSIQSLLLLAGAKRSVTFALLRVMLSFETTPFTSLTTVNSNRYRND